MGGLPKITSNNKELAELVGKLCTTIVDNGGFLEPEMEIECQDNMLSIRFEGDTAPRGYLMDVPAELLLPTDRFTLGLKGDDLYVKDTEPEVTEIQKELMDIMLGIYNHCDKIKIFRETSIRAVCDENVEIAQCLIKGYSDYEALLDKEFAVDDDDYIVEAFFHSRALLFDISGGGPEKKEKVLMPIVDFLNHNQRGARYACHVDEQTKQRSLRMEAGRPIDGSTECFACYGPYDSLDTLLNYQYPDSYAPFVRSVSVSMDLPGIGRIEIGNNRQIVRHADLPPEVADLQFYMPQWTVLYSKKLAKLSHIMIPQKFAGRSLRRVLHFVLKAMAPTEVQEIRHRAVLKIEKEIIQRNISHYKGLVQLLDDAPCDGAVSPVLQSVRAMAEIQLSKIEAYPFFNSDS